VNKKEKLKLEETGWRSTECYDPIGGNENADGYVRVLNPLDEQNLIMRHRLHWRLSHRLPIPEKMEIDHLCKNRRCCNVRHLALICRVEHKVVTNKERYASVIEAGKGLLSQGVPVKDVADITDRSEGCVRSWKRELNKNGSH